MAHAYIWLIPASVPLQNSNVTMASNTTNTNAQPALPPPDVVAAETPCCRCSKYFGTDENLVCSFRGGLRRCQRCASLRSKCTPVSFTSLGEFKANSYQMPRRLRREA